MTYNPLIWENAIGLGCETFMLKQNKSAGNNLLHFQTELIDFFRGGYRIIAGVAREAEAVFRHTGCLDHAIHSQIVQRIQSDKFSDGFFISFFCGNQLALGGKINAVRTREKRGWTTDDHVNFFHPDTPQVLHTIATGCAADDRIFNNQYFLSFQQVPHRIKFYTHAKITHRLGGLNKGSAYIVITNHAHFKLYAAFFSVTKSRVVARIRERHYNIHIRLVFACQFMTQSFAAQINVLAENLAIGTGKVNQLKNTVTMFDLGKRCQAFTTIFIDNNNFTGFYITDVLCTHKIKSAGLGGDNPTAV